MREVTEIREARHVNVELARALHSLQRAKALLVGIIACNDHTENELNIMSDSTEAVIAELLKIINGLSELSAEMLANLWSAKTETHRDGEVTLTIPYPLLVAATSTSQPNRAIPAIGPEEGAITATTPPTPLPGIKAEALPNAPNRPIYLDRYENALLEFCRQQHNKPFTSVDVLQLAVIRDETPQNKRKFINSLEAMLNTIVMHLAQKGELARLETNEDTAQVKAYKLIFGKDNTSPVGEPVVSPHRRTRVRPKRATTPYTPIAPVLAPAASPHPPSQQQAPVRPEIASSTHPTLDAHFDEFVRIWRENTDRDAVLLSVATRYLMEATGIPQSDESQRINLGGEIWRLSQERPIDATDDKTLYGRRINGNRMISFKPFPKLAQQSATERRESERHSAAEAEKLWRMHGVSVAAMVFNQLRIIEPHRKQPKESQEKTVVKVLYRAIKVDLDGLGIDEKVFKIFLRRLGDANLIELSESKPHKTGPQRQAIRFSSHEYWTLWGHDPKILEQKVLDLIVNPNSAK